MAEVPRVALMPSGDAKSSSPIRVAVLNVGNGADDVAAFTDLVMIALEGKEGIELLERAAVERILKEHELSLANADQEEQRAVKTGKILAVNMFLLIEKVEQANRTEQHLRIRAVETKYGLKLADYMIKEPSPQTIDALAASTAARTALLSGKACPDPNKTLLVSVSGFRDIQAALESDSNNLSSILVACIENRLLHSPGVVLLERNRTAPLTTERELVAGLPEALRPSAVLIDGEYELDHSTGKLALTVRLSRSRHNPQLMEFEGRLDSIETLEQQIVTWIKGQIGVKTPASVMDPMVEADLLFAQAAVEKSLAECLALAEAGLSLAPHNRGCQLNYLQQIIIKKFSQAPWNGWPRNSFTKERVRTVFDRLMMAEEAEKGEPWTSDQASILSKAILLIDPYRPPSWGTPDQPMGMVNREVWTALKIIKENKQPRYFSSFVPAAAKIPDPRKAGQALRDLCETVGGSSILLQVSALPSGEPMPSKRSLAIYPPLFEKLTKSPDGRLVLAAKRGKAFMAMHGWQGTSKIKFRGLYEDFESSLLEQGALKYGYGRNWLKPFLDHAKFFDNAAKDFHYKADHEEHIAEFVLKHQLVGDMIWFHTWPECVSLLERTGRPADAISLFRRIINESRHIKKGKWVPYMERNLEHLLKRHPHLAESAASAPLDERYTGRLIVSKETLFPLGQARGILSDDEVLALIYDKGILRLNKDSLAVLDIEKIPQEAGLLLGSAVAEGRTIYAQCAKGIVVIPWKDKKSILRYRQEIPGDFIISYDVLQGKLYTVLTSAPHAVNTEKGNSMAEIDPKTGGSRMLLSSTAMIRGMKDLNFKSIGGTFSDRTNKRVFFYVREGTSEIGTYIYSPKEEKVSKSIIEFGPGAFWRRCGNTLVLHDSSDARFYDIEKGIFLARISQRKGYGRLLNLPRLAFACRVGQGAVVKMGVQGYVDPMYYPPGKNAPQKMSPMLFPHRQDPPRIVDAIMHKRGLLVLTSEGLYLSEGMLSLTNNTMKPHVKDADNK